jgi:hypothetical protein
LLFSLERLRQRGELTFDVFEQKPLFDNLHQKFIAQVAAAGDDTTRRQRDELLLFIECGIDRRGFTCHHG